MDHTSFHRELWNGERGFQIDAAELLLHVPSSIAMLVSCVQAFLHMLVAFVAVIFGPRSIDLGNAQVEELQFRQRQFQEHPPMRPYYRDRKVQRDMYPWKSGGYLRLVMQGLGNHTVHEMARQEFSSVRERSIEVIYAVFNEWAIRILPTDLALIMEEVGIPQYVVRRTLKACVREHKVTLPKSRPHMIGERIARSKRLGNLRQSTTLFKPWREREAIRVHGDERGGVFRQRCAMEAQLHSRNGLWPTHCFLAIPSTRLAQWNNSTQGGRHFVADCHVQLFDSLRQEFYHLPPTPWVYIGGVVYQHATFLDFPYAKKHKPMMHLLMKYFTRQSYERKTLVRYLTRASRAGGWVLQGMSSWLSGLGLTHKMSPELQELIKSGLRVEHVHRYPELARQLQRVGMSADLIARTINVVANVCALSISKDTASFSFSLIALASALPQTAVTWTRLIAERISTQEQGPDSSVLVETAKELTAAVVTETVLSTTPGFSTLANDAAKFLGKHLRDGIGREFARDFAQWLLSLIHELKVRIQACIRSRSLKPLLGYGMDPNHWIKEAHGMMAHKGTLVGTIQDKQTMDTLTELRRDSLIPLWWTQPVSMTEYMARISRHLEQGEKLKGMLKGDPKLESLFNGAFKRLADWRDTDRATVAAGRNRIVPFCLFLAGPAGVGKTNIARLMATVIAQRFGYDPTAAGCYTWDPTANFQTGLDHTKWYVACDDVDQEKVNNQYVHVSIMRKLMNNAALSVEEAAVERKGTTHAMPTFITWTTNYANGNLEPLVQRDPTVFWRRIGLYVKVLPKPAYADGIQLDISKAKNAKTHDLFDFYVRKYDARLVNTSNMYATFPFTPARKMNISELSRTVVEAFERNLHHQTDRLDDLGKPTGSMCPTCYLPCSKECACEVDEAIPFIMQGPESDHGLEEEIPRPKAPRPFLIAASAEEMSQLLEPTWDNSPLYRRIFAHVINPGQGFYEVKPGRDEMVKRSNLLDEYRGLDDPLSILTPVELRGVFDDGGGEDPERVIQYYNAAIARRKIRESYTRVATRMNAEGDRREREAERTGKEWLIEAFEEFFPAIGEDISTDESVDLAWLASEKDREKTWYWETPEDWEARQDYCTGTWTWRGFFKQKWLDSARWWARRGSVKDYFPDLSPFLTNDYVAYIATALSLAAIAIAAVYFALKGMFALQGYVFKGNVFYRKSEETTPANAPKQMTYVFEEMAKNVEACRVIIVKNGVTQGSGLLVAPNLMLYTKHLAPVGTATELRYGSQTIHVNVTPTNTSEIEHGGELVLLMTPGLTPAASILPYLEANLPSARATVDSVQVHTRTQRFSSSGGRYVLMPRWGPCIEGHDIHTIAGDCGSPWFTCTGGVWVLTGLHVAINMGLNPTTMACTFYRDNLERAAERLGVRVQGVATPASLLNRTAADTNFGPPLRVSEVKHAHDCGADIEVLGTMSPRPFGSSPKTNVVRTLFPKWALDKWDQFGPQVWGPPKFQGLWHQDTQRFESPFQMSFFSRKHNVDWPTLLVSCADYVCGMERLDVSGLRILSDAETIIGNPDLLANAVNFKTSVGPPYNQNKRLHIAVVEGAAYVSPSVNAIDEDLDVLLRNGYAIAPLGRCVLKDEPVKNDKKPRVFTVVASSVNALHKKYLAPLKKMMRSNFDFFESAVGIDMSGVESMRVPRKLRMVRPDLDAVLERDAHKLDKAWNADLWVAVTYVWSAMAQVAKVDPCIVQSLMTGLSCTLFEYKGDVFRSKWNPSGHDTTVECNGILMSICHRYEFYRTRPDLVERLLPDALAWRGSLLGVYHPPSGGYCFRAYSSLVHYGDDTLQTFRRDFQFPANSKQIWEEELGIQMCSAADKTQMAVFVPFTRVRFLKRAFVWCPELNRWLNPIKPETLLKMLTYRVRSELSDRDHLCVSMSNVLREYVLFNERERYAELRALFFDVASQMNLVSNPYLDLPAFEVRWEQVRDGTYSAWEGVA